MGWIAARCRAAACIHNTSPALPASYGGPAADAWYQTNLMASNGQQREGCWLQGHNRPVTGLAWSEDDTQLISVGGSACYFWQLPAGRRIAAMDHVDLSQARPDAVKSWPHKTP